MLFDAFPDQLKNLETNILPRFGHELTIEKINVLPEWAKAFLLKPVHSDGRAGPNNRGMSRGAWRDEQQRNSRSSRDGY